MPLWFQEGEGGEIMGMNQRSFENLLYVGQGCGSLKETLEMGVIFVKYCARCTINYLRCSEGLQQ